MLEILNNYSKKINYILVKNLFQVFKTPVVFLFLHENYSSFFVKDKLFSFCKLNNIFLINFRLIKKVTLNKNIHSLVSGPSLVFYSNDILNFLKLLENKNFKTKILPLSLYLKPYLINPNYFTKYLTISLLSNIKSKLMLFFISFLYNYFIYLLMFQKNFLYKLKNIKTI